MASANLRRKFHRPPKWQHMLRHEGGQGSGEYPTPCATDPFQNPALIREATVQAEHKPLRMVCPRERPAKQYPLPLPLPRISGSTRPMQPIPLLLNDRPLWPPNESHLHAPRLLIEQRGRRCAGLPTHTASPKSPIPVSSHPSPDAAG